MDYTNNDIVGCLRQYEMFASSLDMISNNKDKENIYHQLDKLEEKIIRLTNEIYEEEYVTLLNRKTSLLDEEKTRITLLIDLINQRLNYIETRKNNHKLLTNHTIDYGSTLGENLLEELEDRIKIIDKYTSNIKIKEEALKCLEDLNNKITLAEEKIKINTTLNKELETKMKEVLQNAFVKLKLYDYSKNSDEIEKAYKELKYSLRLAEDNVKMAKERDDEILLECENMVNSVKKDYEEYKEKYVILRLMEIFNAKVKNYDELLAKREKMNDLLTSLEGTKFYEITSPELNKQYNTIKIEKQDINTYNYLLIEKNEKEEIIKEIDNENNSDKFKKVLEDLIANEKRKKEEEIREEQKKIEKALERKQELERRRQEELLKRQRLTQENRKKEIEQRTKQLLEEKEKSVFNKEKLEETSNNLFSFETIKNKVNKEEPTSEIHENPPSKIEQELFAEFNRTVPKTKEDEFWTVEEANVLESDDIPVIGNNTINKEKMTNKIPNEDYESYMKNFEKKTDEEFFTSPSIFPDIPQN